MTGGDPIEVHPPRLTVRKLVGTGALYALADEPTATVTVTVAGHPFAAERFRLDQDALIIDACPSITTLRMRQLAEDRFAYELREAMRWAGIPPRPPFEWQGREVRTLGDVRRAMLACLNAPCLNAFRAAFRSVDPGFADDTMDLLAAYMEPATRDRLLAWLGAPTSRVAQSIYGGDR